MLLLIIKCSVFLHQLNVFISFVSITNLTSPGALTQAIRNFAKSLENWLTGAMINIPEEMVRIKVLVLL